LGAAFIKNNIVAALEMPNLTGPVDGILQGTVKENDKGFPPLPADGFIVQTAAVSRSKIGHCLVVF
jgi:hypothetical protein